MKRPNRFVVVLAFPMLAACYSYTTVPIDSVPVQSAVRVRISGTLSDSLSQQLGRDEDHVVEGELVERRSDAILLALPNSLVAPDGSLTPTYQRVMLPQSGISDIEIRKLNRWKTGGLVALAASVVGYIAVQQFTKDDGSLTPNKPGSNK